VDKAIKSHDGRDIVVRARIMPPLPPIMGLPAQEPYIETCHARWIMSGAKLSEDEYAEHIDENWVMQEALKQHAQEST
jgi:hypothetical protein